MEVCDATIKNNSTFKSFLRTVHACVHSLIKKPIVTQESHRFTPECDGDHTPLSTRVVKCSTGKVHKYYDNMRWHAKPNYEIIISLGEHALPGVVCRPLSVDKRFQLLEYWYIEGTHRPGSIRQVARSIAILGKLHEQNYVHSDIRTENLLFMRDNKTAFIIDFDHVDEVAKEYPQTYNHYEIQERHTQARASLPRQKLHDRHALYVIFMWKSKYSLKLTQQSDSLKKLLDEGTMLSTISSELLQSSI